MQVTAKDNKKTSFPPNITGNIFRMTVLSSKQHCQTLLQNYTLYVFSQTYCLGWHPSKVDGNMQAWAVLNRPSACASLRRMPPHMRVNTYRNFAEFITLSAYITTTGRIITGGRAFGNSFLGPGRWYFGVVFLSRMCENENLLTKSAFLQCKRL